MFKIVGLISPAILFQLIALIGGYGLLFFCVIILKLLLFVIRAAYCGNVKTLTGTVGQ